MNAIDFEYRFQMEDGKSDSFRVRIDAQNLQVIDPFPPDPPDWTKLDSHQCPNCLLDASKIHRCPAAVHMAPLVIHFQQLLSYDQTSVRVITAERTICSDTTVQRGICSLMGLLMAASGCPLTAFFKPMARFHLPFASMEETIWRATSAYLMAQYFQYRNNNPFDLKFEGLSHIYRQIQIVNHSFAQRLRSACQHDSMINAIILLDMFAKSMPFAIEDSLEQIRHLFTPYMLNIDPGKGPI